MNQNLCICIQYYLSIIEILNKLHSNYGLYGCIDAYDTMNVTQDKKVDYLIEFKICNAN